MSTSQPSRGEIRPADNSSRSDRPYDTRPTRAADALAQMALDDDAAFQGFLESTDASDRLARLADDALREGTRVARRAALSRAFAASA